MIAGQKLKASDGKEVALFPCDAMYLTEARTPPEHDVYALDFLPRNTSGATITRMPCYAPFTGEIVYTGNDHNCILESRDKVHFPDGSLAYMRVLVAHDEYVPTLMQRFNQGDLFYHSGNYGLSGGEHLHMEVAKIDQKTTPYWNTGGVGLKNGIHMWDGLYVNNTTLLRDGGFDWKTWEGKKYYKKSKFPWVLYANKLRNYYEN